MTKRKLSSLAILMSVVTGLAGADLPVPSSNNEKKPVADSPVGTQQNPEPLPAPKDGDKKPAKEADKKPAAAPAPAANATPAAAAAPTTNTSAAAQKPKVDLRDYHSGPPECMWIDADYLLWWTKSGPLPVTLASTSPGASLGVLGNPGTTVLIGNTSFDYGTQSGLNLNGGVWLDECHTVAWESGLFFLGRGSSGASTNSDGAGNPLIARPFFNTQTNAQASDLVAFPNFFTGGVAVTTSSQFWGMETNLVRNICYSPCFRADVIFGFRYLALEEGMNVYHDSNVIPGSPASLFINNVQSPAGTGSLVVTDRFGTVNRFYGGQLGMRTQQRRGNWILDLTGKVGLGPNHETVNILGQTMASFPGTGTTTSGGVLALPGANYARGNATTDYFAVVPEIKCQIGYQITQALSAHVGYDFLYISGVARPGNHIDTNINPRLIPSSPAFGTTSGPINPNLSIRQEDFWAQGINFGLSVKY